MKLIFIILVISISTSYVTGAPLRLTQSRHSSAEEQSNAKRGLPPGNVGTGQNQQQYQAPPPGQSPFGGRQYSQQAGQQVGNQQRMGSNLYESQSSYDSAGSNGQMQASDQNILDGVEKLAEEMVEAVVERLEEDEAMAIELDRQGFDPDVYSDADSRTSIFMLIIMLIITCLNL